MVTVHGLTLHMEYATPVNLNLSRLGWAAVQLIHLKEKESDPFDLF